MLERVEKLKHFFIYILGQGIGQRQGRGILEGPFAALHAAEPTLFRAASPPARVRGTPLGRGPTGRTPHC